MLILARRIGETVLIGENVELIVVGFKGRQVKFGIKAPRDISVMRGELLEDERVRRFYKQSREMSFSESFLNNGER